MGATGAPFAPHCTRRTIAPKLDIPGSEFFIVYSDGRNTSEAPVPGLVNRSVALKLTRLLRF